MQLCQQIRTDNLSLRNILNRVSPDEVKRVKHGGLQSVTKATAFFMIKYMKTFGFKVNNDIQNKVIVSFKVQ